MNRLYDDDVTPPPFYALIQLNAGEGMDAGQYSEAVAVMTSVAMLKPGFMGFGSDNDANQNPVRIAYFDSHDTLQTWLHESHDLLPYATKLDDVISGTGCLWHWLGNEQEEEKRYALHVV